MTILVVGASGATGKLLVEQLLKQHQHVKILVRDASALPESIQRHDNVSIIQAAVVDLSEAEMSQHLKGCDAVASCLGHNLNIMGLYGQPRRLVTDAVSQLCKAVISNNPEKPVKFVLMNTSGNSNRDLSERISWAQTCVIWLLRLLLPPHVDNEKAADFLRTEIGQHHQTIEWVAVRPDGLIDAAETSAYALHPSPIRSAIFDAGQISRINVASCMADLIMQDELWHEWKGKMPVLYNKT